MSADVRDVQQRVRITAAALVLLVVIAMPLPLWWYSARSSASFADSEVLAANHLGAATLDVEIGDATVRFEALNMAPGDAVSGQLEVVNAGSLPLRYWLTASTDGSSLTDWLAFDVWDTAGICGPETPGSFLASGVALSLSKTLLVGTLDASDRENERRLAVGQAQTICLRGTLPITAPNTVQGQGLELELVIGAEHDVEASQ